MKLSKLGLVGVLYSLTISISNAGAAVEPQATAMRWGGMYLGINSGTTYQTTILPENIIATQPLGLVVLANGGLLGFNVTVAKRLVFSLEGGGDYYSSSRDHFARHWAASARARIGYGGNKFMPYLAGGVLVVGPITLPQSFRDKVDISALAFPHVGYTAGAGLDIAYSSNLFFRMEYRFNFIATQKPFERPTIDKAIFGLKSHEGRLAVVFKY